MLYLRTDFSCDWEYNHSHYNVYFKTGGRAVSSSTSFFSDEHMICHNLLDVIWAVLKKIFQNYNLVELKLSHEESVFFFYRKLEAETSPSEYFDDSSYLKKISGIFYNSYTLT